MSVSGAAGCWIEAMRLRTLPVSVAGVVYGVALGLAAGHVRPVPVVLCLLFALLAQIASNFANEYYDFKGGLDRVGREGPRRGVTEGDITPAAMKAATYATLGAACVTGCILVWLYGAWWMYVAGIVTAAGVVAYSAGPYPLSHHGLGEVAVVGFFGIVPVCLTYLLMGGDGGLWLVAAGAGIGLMGANVLVVNNYRDMEDDRQAGKRTLAVRIGRRAMGSVYLSNGFMAVILTLPEWVVMGRRGAVVPMIYIVLHMLLWYRMIHRRGRALNPLLGMTAMLMLSYSVTYLVMAAL